MRPNVLFVDDDRRLLDALRRSLLAQPFDITLAADGIEALSVMSRTAIAVIVADQDMPGMSGSALLAKVRFDYPGTMLFMLTGRATLDLAISAINLGEVHRFFTKPCHPEELAAGIRDAIRQRQLLRFARRLLIRARREDCLVPKNPRPPMDDGVADEYAPHDMDALLDALSTYLDEGLPESGSHPADAVRTRIRLGRTDMDRR